ncbi:hypothetical protein CPB86DRAFT_225634 [Serendipita vermifera]|nr:hypothetical protein CPB86DRAFT_225634 [Serendipita vermifera]
MEHSSCFDTEGDEVNRLEEELNQALMRQVLIKWELASILQGGDVFYNQEVGIHSLPIEILVQILYGLLLLPNEVHIGRLMRVCRRWQQVILETPLLWSIVDIRVPSDLDKLNICAAYCQTSVKRSASSLLDISLYFSDVSGPDWTLSMMKERSGIIWNEDLWQCKLLLRAVYSELSSYLDHIQPIYARREEILSTFVGYKGEVMVRWKSFKCDFFYNPVIPFLERGGFSYPTPSLETLIFDTHSQPFTKRYRGEVYYAYNLPDEEDTPFNFPHMPKIHTLHLSNIETVAEKHGINRSSIRELACSCKTRPSLRFILTLGDLTHLQIGYSGSDPILEHNPITFPHLRSLSIIRGIARSFWAVFEAPKLESIFLKDLIDYEGLQPSISINYIFPSLQEIRISHRWGHFSLNYFDLLHKLIRHAPMLVSIKCWPGHELIRSMKYWDCGVVSLSRSNKFASRRLAHTSQGQSPSQTIDITTLLTHTSN